MPDVTPADLLAAWEMLGEGERPEGLLKHPELDWWCDPDGAGVDQVPSAVVLHDRLLVAIESALMTKHSGALGHGRLGWDWDTDRVSLSDPSRFRAALLALRAERGRPKTAP